MDWIPHGSGRMDTGSWLPYLSDAFTPPFALYPVIYLTVRHAMASHPCTWLPAMACWDVRRSWCRMEPMCTPKMPWASSPSTTADYGTTATVPGEPMTTTPAAAASGKVLPYG